MLGVLPFVEYRSCVCATSATLYHTIGTIMLSYKLVQQTQVPCNPCILGLLPIQQQQQQLNASTVPSVPRRPCLCPCSSSGTFRLLSSLSCFSQKFKIAFLFLVLTLHCCWIYQEENIERALSLLDSSTTVENTQIKVTKNGIWPLILF